MLTTSNDNRSLDVDMQEEPQEVAIESISFAQFGQAMLGQEIQGIPIGKGYVVPKRDKSQDKPGEELSKHRVYVKFEIDVTCNTTPIINSGNDDDIIAHDLALLQQLLKTNNLKEMLGYIAAIELGLESMEGFTERLLHNVEYRGAFERRIFNTAIDHLQDEDGEYWREVRAMPPEKGVGDMLSTGTEDIFQCFSATFVDAYYETATIIDTSNAEVLENDNNNAMD